MSSWSDGFLRLVQFWTFILGIGVPLLGVLIGALCLVARDHAGSELNRRQTVALEKRQEIEVDLRKKEEAALRVRLDQALKRAREQDTRPQGRSITPEQRAKFIAAVEYSPRGKVSVNILSGVDADTSEYADQIREMITAAGYDAGSGVGVGYGRQIPAGISMLVGHPQHPFAGAIQQAFGGIGINATGLIDASIPGDEVRIEVGVKP